MCSATILPFINGIPRPDSSDVQSLILEVRDSSLPAAKRIGAYFEVLKQEDLSKLSMTLATELLASNDLSIRTEVIYAICLAFLGGHADQGELSVEFQVVSAIINSLRNEIEPALQAASLAARALLGDASAHETAKAVLELSPAIDQTKHSHKEIRIMNSVKSVARAIVDNNLVRVPMV